jgi:hypothetical protein
MREGALIGPSITGVIVKLSPKMDTTHISANNLPLTKIAMEPFKSFDGIYS